MSFMETLLLLLHSLIRPYQASHFPPLTHKSWVLDTFGKGFKFHFFILSIKYLEVFSGKVLMCVEVLESKLNTFTDRQANVYQ